MMVYDGRELFALRVSTLDAATVRAVLTLVRYHAEYGQSQCRQWEQLKLFARNGRGWSFWQRSPTGARAKHSQTDRNHHGTRTTQEPKRKAQPVAR